MDIVMYDVSGWNILIIVVHHRTYKACVDSDVDLDVDSADDSEDDITKGNETCMLRVNAWGMCRG